MPRTTEKFIKIHVGRDKRDVLLSMQIRGYKTVAETIPAIVKHLNTEGIAGKEAGKVDTVKIIDQGISVITENCGFWLTNDFIARAVKAKGKKVLD